MRTLILGSILTVLTYKAQAQQFSANELLQMLSFTESKLETVVKKKGYIFSEEETKGDTAYKTFTVRPSKSKKKMEYAGCSIALGHIQEDAVILYNTMKPEDFTTIKVTLEKKHFLVTKLFDNCPPSFLLFRSKEFTVTCHSFKQDTLTFYSFLFHKKSLPAKQGILFAEDLLQFESHEYLTAVFGAEHIKSDVYYFSDKEVNKCSVLFPNTSMQVVFLWKDELQLKELLAIVIGGRDEMRKPSDPKTETIVSENKWRFHNNIYIGINLQQLRNIHGENFEIFGANSKYTGLISAGKTGAIAFYKHNYVMGCLNCKESPDFRRKELISADEAARKGLILFLSSVTLFPEKLSE